MIGTLISVILMLIVLGVVLWGVQRLLPLVPMDPRVATIVNVLITIVIVLVVVWIIASLLGVVAPIRL